MDVITMVKEKKRSTQEPHQMNAQDAARFKNGIM